MFTDFQPNVQINDYVGNSVIAVTLLIIAINASVMIYSTYFKLKLFVRKLRYKYRVWRNKRKTVKI